MPSYLARRCILLFFAHFRVLSGSGVNKRQTTEMLPRSTDLYTPMFLVASGTENAAADELDKHWPRKPVCVSSIGLTKIA